MKPVCDRTRKTLLLVAALAAAGAPARAAERRAPIKIIRPADNPLAKPGGRVPVPTIVFDDVRVREDHPRLLMNKDSLEAMRQRYLRHRLRASIAKQAQGGDPLAGSLLYQLSGRRSYGDGAIRKLLDGAVSQNYVAYVFDWAIDGASDAQREEAIRTLENAIFVDRSTGWPRCSPYKGFPDDPRPSETSPEEWLDFYNWTFHDQDWCRAYGQLFARMIALAHHAPRMAEGVRNYWEYSLLDVALFYDHLRDGSYYQGEYWSVTNRIEEIIRTFTHVKTATGLDYLDHERHPYLGNVGRWMLYCSDHGKMQMIWKYGESTTRPLIRSALLASNSLARDPYVAWLVNRTEVPGIGGAGWLREVLYYDTTLVAKRPGNLHPSRAFPGHGLVVMRSGWAESDPFVCIQFQDWWDTHNHADVGSFIIYCKSPLAPDSGTYCPGGFHHKYSASTIAHNTITVRDPTVRDPYYCGGQRGRDVRVWTYAIGRAAWVYHQDKHDRGDLLAYQTHRLYDYSAGQGHKGYRPEHVKEFVRQSVFLRDGFYIVFDRVEATRDDLEKRWLMHFVGEPKVNGRLLHTEVKGHIEDFDGDLSISQGKLSAMLRVHTLLPAKHRIRRIGGAIPKIPVSTLIRVPRSKYRMGTGSRWAWTDPLILKYKDPITGRELGAIGFERNSPTDVTYEISDTHLYMLFNAYERGRKDEIRLRLADYPDILQLVRDINTRRLWHLRVLYLPGYEYYLNGVNHARYYQIGQWKDLTESAPELLGKPNDIGSWRIEVYPTTKAKRDYFLHAIRIMKKADAETGKVDYKDAADKAQVSVDLAGKTYVITFNKTGKVGGHIRIVDVKGQVLADADFADKIVQEPWPKD